MCSLEVGSGYMGVVIDMMCKNTGSLLVVCGCVFFMDTATTEIYTE